MTDHLVYVDTEFTNLDPRLGDVIEAGWALDDDPVQVTLFPHTLEHASNDALKINRYFERGLDQYALAPGESWSLTGEHRRLMRDLAGNTIVAENYGIDVAKLMHKLGYEPWHYRKIELSSVALTVFHLDRPESQKTTADRLRGMGFDIPEPTHSAYHDVECLRACYKALRELGGARLAGVEA